MKFILGEGPAFCSLWGAGAEATALQGHRAGPLLFGPAYLYVGFAFPESLATGRGWGKQAGEVGLKVSECLTFRWQEIICEPRIRHREPWFESRRPSVERKGWRVRTSQRREACSAMTQHKQQWRSLAALGPSCLLGGCSWRVSSDLGSVESPGLKAVDFCAQIRQ